MTGRPPAYLLDVTRLVARAGRDALTGIDRIELAYLTRLLAEPVTLFGLVGASGRAALLDRAGLGALHERIVGATAWGRADIVARLMRQPEARGRAQSDVRRLAVARARLTGLAGLLAGRLPGGTVYLNIGHMNMGEPVLAAVRGIPGARIEVLLHDTIPLDYPEFSGPGAAAAFAQMLRQAGRFADLVICNSDQTRRDAERHLSAWGRIPPMLVAQLGVGSAVPDPGALPPDLDLGRPYFVTVGTIEPRKNHALLLDVWEGFAGTAEPVPRLFIVGSRGWRNEAVFARLDALLPGGPVRELSGLSDGAVAALLTGAAGLLFPSFAEGFGLPPAEAARLGVPVLCNDLPVYREFLGDYPVYVPVADRYLWSQGIRKLAGEASQQSDMKRMERGIPVPTWEGHFNLVLSHP